MGSHDNPGNNIDGRAGDRSGNVMMRKGIFNLWHSVACPSLHEAVAGKLARGGAARDHATGAGHLALVVGHSGDRGGMEKFCRFLAEIAADAGWRVTVALSGENIYGSLPARLTERIRIDRVDWVDRTCAGDRDYAWTTIMSRRRWFRAMRPDVAVVVQSSNTPFRCAIVGARLAGVPVISTHRTMPWLLEHVPSRRHCVGLLPGLGLYSKRMVARTALAGWLANRIVYNNDAVRRDYERTYRYPTGRGVVIRNGVHVADEDVPGRGCPGSPGDADDVVIGFAGRLLGDKRLDVLLRGVAAMQWRNRVRIVLYGQGADQPMLAALAAELGIADRVEWRGAMHDSAAAYAEMDIVALCSPRESSSNMVLEAMAAGKACVVTATGGMIELADAGRRAICVPPLDVPALAVALDRLVDDPALRRQLGERARLKAIGEHDPRIVAGQWLSLLQSVRRRRYSRPCLEREADTLPVANGGGPAPCRSETVWDRTSASSVEPHLADPI